MSDATLTYDSAQNWMCLAMSVLEHIKWLEDEYPGYIPTRDGQNHLRDYVNACAKSWHLSLGVGNRGTKGLRALQNALNDRLGSNYVVLTGDVQPYLPPPGME